jgi:hypothetical protein
MKCPKCNQENKDTAIICEFCGEKLDNNLELSTSETEEKKSNKGIIIGIVIAIVAVIGIVIALGKGSDDEKNVDKMFDAYLNTLKANSYEVTQNIDLNNVKITADDPNVMMAENMLNGLGIEFTNKLDKKQLKVEGKIAFKVQNVDFVGVEYYINKKLAGVNIPILLNKTVFITWKDLINQVKQNTGMELDIKMLEPYKELLNLDNYETANKLSIDPYMEIYKNFYVDAEIEDKDTTVTISDEEVKGTEYALKYNYKDSAKINEQLFEVIGKDENLKAFIIELGEKFIQTVIDNEDYQMYGFITTNDINAYDKWEDRMSEELNIYKSQVKTGVNLGFSQLSNVYSQTYDTEQYDKIMEAMNMDIDQKMFVDKNNYLRKVDSNIALNIEEEDQKFSMDIVSTASYNKINENIEFKNIENDAINLFDLNSQELFNLINQISEKLKSSSILNFMQ